MRYIMLNPILKLIYV